MIFVYTKHRNRDLHRTSIWSNLNSIKSSISCITRSIRLDCSNFEQCIIITIISTQIAIFENLHFEFEYNPSVSVTQIPEIITLCIRKMFPISVFWKNVRPPGIFYIF